MFSGESKGNIGKKRVKKPSSARFGAIIIFLRKVKEPRKQNTYLKILLDFQYTGLLQQALSALYSFSKITILSIYYYTSKKIILIK